MLAHAPLARDIVMIKVKRIGHATFETPDLERQIEYYVGVVGLVLLAKEKDRALFVSRLGNLSVALHRGTAASLTKIAFQVAPDADLNALAKTLIGHGISASVGEALVPGIGKLLTFRDPKQTIIEIFAETYPAAPVTQPTAVGPLKLGHVSFMMPDIHPCIEFYQKVLGFRISDWQEDFFCFMRCGADHHTINFATGKSTRLHHMAFELKDWAHVQIACDHLGRMNVPIIWGQAVTASATTSSPIIAIRTTRSSSSIPKWTRCWTKSSATSSRVPGTRIARSARRCGIANPPL